MNYSNNAQNKRTINFSNISNSGSFADGISSSSEANISLSDGVVKGVDDKKFLTARGRVLMGARYASFMRFWQDFGLTQGMTEAADEWLNVLPGQMLSRDVEFICFAAREEAKAREENKRLNQNYKSAKSWLASRGWEGYKILFDEESARKEAIAKRKEEEEKPPTEEQRRKSAIARKAIRYLMGKLPENEVTPEILKRAKIIEENRIVCRKKDGLPVGPVHHSVDAGTCKRISIGGFPGIAQNIENENQDIEDSMLVKNAMAKIEAFAKSIGADFTDNKEEELKKEKENHPAQIESIQSLGECQQIYTNNNDNKIESDGNSQTSQELARPQTAKANAPRNFNCRRWYCYMPKNSSTFNASNTAIGKTSRNRQEETQANENDIQLPDVDDPHNLSNTSNASNLSPASNANNANNANTTSTTSDDKTCLSLCVADSPSTAFSEEKLKKEKKESASCQDVQVAEVATLDEEPTNTAAISDKIDLAQTWPSGYPSFIPEFPIVNTPKHDLYYYFFFFNFNLFKRDIKYNYIYNNTRARARQMDWNFARKVQNNTSGFTVCDFRHGFSNYALHTVNPKNLPFEASERLICRYPLLFCNSPGRRLSIITGIQALRIRMARAQGP